MGKLEYNTSLGDALHRRECTLKNSKPTMIKRRKTDQILNARNSVSALRAEGEAIFAELYGVPNFATV